MLSPRPTGQPVGRRFRFGVQASALPGGTGGTTAAGWRALARKVEDLGFATLTVADHLDDQLAISPAIQAAADATTTLRVGALVWCNDYRHPVVLAKEAATIDLLSDGRLEVGVGAGWMTSDYAAAGLPLDPPGERIARLSEALDVLEGLWGDEPFSYAGDHYRIAGRHGSQPRSGVTGEPWSSPADVSAGLDGRPKPVQRPRPPILLGGGGPKMLALAGRRADIVGFNINLAKGVIDADAGPDGTASRTDEKVAWVREAAGARFADLELQVRVHLTLVTDDRMAMAEAFAPGLGLSAADGLESPHALCGSTDEIVADLEARRERWGISYIGIGVESLDALAPVVARLAGT